MFPGIVDVVQPLGILRGGKESEINYRRVVVLDPSAVRSPILSEINALPKCVQDCLLALPEAKGRLNAVASDFVSAATAKTCFTAAASADGTSVFFPSIVSSR